MKHQSSEIIPVFFAVDDRYAPFLGVALRSMLAHADPRCFYRIHVLTTGLTVDNQTKLRAELTKNAAISFDDVSEAMTRVCASLPMRDYYSAATYYRIFIGSLFSQYDRALYFDSDLVFCGDIARMYHTDLGGKLIGAVADDVLAMQPVFGDYVETVLGVPRTHYFNAGILLLDLAKYRAMHMEERFLSLLTKRRFAVAQDQDYLNVLCQHDVHYFDSSWNLSAAPANRRRRAKILHYKMNWKPWHEDDVAFAEHFWRYADASAFADDIRAIKRGYRMVDRIRDQMAAERLVATAVAETETARAQACQPICSTALAVQE